jgi:linoleoyl-CoA desaturase
MSKISFTNQQTDFFRVLKDKVDRYFTDNDILPTGNRQLLLKSIYQVLSAIGIYTILVFFNPGNLISIILCILLGFNLAIIGFNVMHEGGHQSFSKYKWLNSISAYFLNALGGNSFFWKVKHNINHHTYTNIEGHDSDIDVEPMMRLNENQQRRWFHKFQHIYFVFLYGLSYITWIFYNDFEKYFTRRLAPSTPKRKFEVKEHVIFWCTKLGYIGVYIVLPIFMVGFVEAIIGFFIVTFVCGLFIAIVFQLAHVVEDTHFPVPNSATNKIEHEWAIHQLNTTANFDTKNRLISWFMGGLNFQIEHHLFPKISHVHYPKISEFVKHTCEEFNITYIEYSSMFKAFRSHYSHIRKLGKA